MAKAKTFATVKGTKEGDILTPDEGFTCLDIDKRYIVYKDNIDMIDKLYICCSAGLHYLDGQIKNKHYVGLYKCKTLFK